MGVTFTNHSCGCRIREYDNGLVEVDFCKSTPPCETRLNAKPSTDIQGWILECVEQEGAVPAVVKAVMANVVTGDYTVVEDSKFWDYGGDQLNLLTTVSIPVTFSLSPEDIAVLKLELTDDT